MCVGGMGGGGQGGGEPYDRGRPARVWGIAGTVEVSFEVFKRSPQPLKAGIVAIVVSRRFMEFSMYSHRCIIAGTVAACSACDLIRPAASPYLSPCTLANPKSDNR